MLFLWIFFYGLVYSLAEAVTPFAGNSPWLTPLCMLGYILFLLRQLVRAKKMETVGLCPMQVSETSDILYLLPLLILPAMNLYSGGTLAPLRDILLMLCISVAEELLFRGYLLSVFFRRLGFWGIPGSALVFALAHCANLLSGAPVFYILVQIQLAFFAGSYYSLVRMRFQSLLPCIAAHFLTNITAGSGIVLPNQYLIPIALFCIFGSGLFSKLSSELEDIS